MFQDYGRDSSAIVHAFQLTKKYGKSLHEAVRQFNASTPHDAMIFLVRNDYVAQAVSSVFAAHYNQYVWREDSQLPDKPPPAYSYHQIMRFVTKHLELSTNLLNALRSNRLDFEIMRYEDVAKEKCVPGFKGSVENIVPKHFKHPDMGKKEQIERFRSELEDKPKDKMKIWHLANVRNMWLERSMADRIL